MIAFFRRLSVRGRLLFGISVVIPVAAIVFALVAGANAFQWFNDRTTQTCHVDRIGPMETAGSRSPYWTVSTSCGPALVSAGSSTIPAAQSEEIVNALQVAAPAEWVLTFEGTGARRYIIKAVGPDYGPGPTVTASPVTASPVPTPTSSPVAPPTLRVGDVVASGSITSGDGKETAGVVVTAGPAHGFRVTLSSIHNARGAAIDLSVVSKAFVGPGDCYAPGARTDLGTLNGSSTQSFLLSADVATEDPDYLHGVILEPVPGENTKCVDDAVGAATLTWTLPNMRPDLHAVDHGPTAGADGAAGHNDVGSTYYVAAEGDSFAKVAARFGISVDDLEYLNPQEYLVNGIPTIHAGDQLNLSTSTR